MNQGTFYLILMTGLLLWFHIMGIIDPSASSNIVLLNALTDPSTMATQEFFTAIVGYTVAGAAGIVLGYWFKNVEIAMMIPIGWYMFNILKDFLAVYAAVAEQNKVLAMLLFSPLLFLWIFTVVEYIRGRD